MFGLGLYELIALALIVVLATCVVWSFTRNRNGGCDRPTDCARKRH
jgi:hypothetical protein